jgi:hypothetical protein
LRQVTGWRATFYTSGMEHSVTSATASAPEPTPWRAVQVAAWEASGKTGFRSSHHGAGDHEVPIKDHADLEVAKSFIQMTYEHVGG